MTLWAHRSGEEQYLLNPSFCALLLWHAAYRRQAEHLKLLSFEESFLILPFVLHRKTREDLPRSSRTSLPVWLDQYPLARGRVASSANVLAPFTREALMFAGIHRFIAISAGGILADDTRVTAVNGVLSGASDEVRLCAKRASFVGKWFAEAGSTTTVLALIGVRP